MTASNPLLIRQRHFAIAGAWQIYDWTGQTGRQGATDGRTHATRSVCPDLRRGRACTRNLTEITTAHSPRNKSCVSPTNLACRAELCCRHRLTGCSLLAVSPCFGLRRLQRARVLAPALLTDRLRPPTRPPFGRRSDGAHVEEGCCGGTGPGSTSDGTNCSPEVNLDAKLLLPAHNHRPRGPAAICRGALARSAVACAKPRTGCQAVSPHPASQLVTPL